MFSETYVEKRPLKKPKLGPADVYPQEVKQKEDELTSMNVKHGFATMPQLQEEFGTARNCNVTASKVGAYFNAILAKKEELLTLQDSARKKQHVKDNFWPVTQRTKQTLDNWFKDLAGNKPLSSLAKKAPSFNKKEEIFAMLCENQVTMQRASWFIKLSSAYTAAISEAKIKKRQMPDPATEWTGTMIKFLKDLIPKLMEYYHTGPPLEKPMVASAGIQSSNTVPSSSSSGSSLTVPVPSASPASASLIPVPATPQEEQKLALKQWTYCTQLCKYMFEEGLLDKHEFLNWILDMFDKLRTQPSEDGILKLYLPVALSYMQDFVQSEKLSRKMAYLAAKKLSSMIHEMVNHLSLDVNAKADAAKAAENADAKPLSPYEKALEEYLTCPQHRDTVIQLSCILQVITLDCPTALIWSGVGDNRPSVLAGSPLDHLPVAPSTLPMPEKSPKSNAEYRIKLKLAEINIKHRSQQAESRWCTDKWRTLTGNSTVKLLTILDTLDSYFFDRMDVNNSLDTLYSKIFPQLPEPTKDESKDSKIEFDANTDEDTVKILCEWAVSTHRWGEYRAMAVGRLLDKRQTEVLMNENESNNVEDKDSDNGSVGTPIYQGILLRFLDSAPVLEDNGNAQNKAQFKNLVHLFSELIRNDVFSHDAYMCTLISRGDLVNGAPPNLSNNISSKNILSNPGGSGGGDDDFFSEIDFKPPKMEEFDDSNVDDDLEKLIQNIKDGQNNSMDAPDSPKDHENLTNIPSISNEKNALNSSSANCRHYLYTLHFPLSQDDASQHDCNQRYILLYGVGKERDERKHSVKKMSKEICKLFSKKFSIDVAEGGKKKQSRSEFNFESTLNKCQSMCYFDQHFVTWQCAVTVQEMLNSFAMGNSNYLPVAEHVAFLFDLMEVALNIYGVIDMCIQILKELPDVEAQLMAKNSSLMKNYTTTLSLYLVGVLRRYNSCLLLSPEQTTAVFEGLCKVVKHVTNPSDCSSAERCILAYLYELYLACSILKTKPTSEPFHNAYPKIKQTIYAPIKPTQITQPYNPQFMGDILANPKRGGKIESSWGRQLSESAMNRYSFVCNAIVAITRETDNDKLNDIAIMCAELTACCNSLSAEWLGALGALCNTKNESGYYMEILNSVDLQNVHMYNSIAVFACILVARHCFALVDFVAIVALPALLIYYRSDTIMNEVEASARLTCHILLRLFQAIEYPQPGMYSVSTSPIQVIGPMHSNIKLSCDRLLLGGAHKNISVAPVLAVLKAILVVADATVHKTTFGSGKKSGFNTPVHPGSTPKSMSGPVDLSHILGTREDMGMLDGDDPMLEIGSSSNNLNNSENAPSLSEFAQHVLKQICTQEWVLECCLKNCDEMCSSEILLDNMLTNKQAQRLLHMICYDQETNAKIEANMDQKSQIVRILENLEQWSLRISLLDLQLMYKQTQSINSEFLSWLDTVARAAIDVFIPKEERKVGKHPPIWLVSPLVAKLPCEVQGRILKVAGQVLESSNSFGTKNKSSDSSESSGTSGRKRSVQIDHQPFLGLVLTCLKGQDDQKEGLLQSLHSQLSQFLQNKELEFVGGIDDPTGKEEMLNALQLRFSLVGGMFDSIQKNSTTTTDWAILLTQLMSQGVIDLNNNSDLFHTALDMLATLIHSTLVTDSQSERDENKKLHTNLMKKLRKELADKNSPTIKLVRQLLQLAKPACVNNCEIIACEPVGSLMDTKGLRITEKERVTMWDLLEGHKNPGPLLWSWFGAVKMERKPLTYEESHRLLKFHTHSLVKPSSYFYEPLQLPPEDVDEPSQDKNREDKADTPSSAESPSGVPGAKSRKGTKRPRKPKANATPTPTNPNQLVNQMPNQGMNPQMMNQQIMNPQMMNPQMGQQFNPNQNQQMGGNMNMMQGNMGMMNQMNIEVNQQFNPNQQQIGGNMNMMQGNNPNMGQANTMQYQQQQQNNQSMGQMNQMMQGNTPNMGQMNSMQQNNPNMAMSQQQNQWAYNNQQNQQQGVQNQGQQFYNQGAGIPANSGMPAAGPQMNQFVERPQLTQSKQALSNMLRQRHPNQNTQFNIQQQRIQMMQNQNRQQMQLQQRQMLYRARMSGKPMNTPGMMNQQPGAVNVGGMNPMAQNQNSMMQGGQQGMMAGANQVQGMINQQNPGGMGMGSGMGQQPNPNTMQQPQQTILPGPSSGGIMPQNPVPNMMQAAPQAQAAQMMSGNINQNQNMMQQQNVQNQMSGNINQNQNMMQQQNQMSQQGGAGNQNQQGNMFPQQYQNYSGYNNPAMASNQGNIQQQGQGQGGMMNNFQQNAPVAAVQQRNPQADFLAQQQARQRQQQQYLAQQAQQPQQVQQQTPNVTMNTNMAVGSQGNVPPPYRQGGKPMVNPNTQQFQEMRMRQMMLQKQQQQQGMVQQPNNPNMAQNMGPNQTGLQQQTPALVAQLQRQLPNQMNPNMMNQQNQQQNFNQGPF